MSKEIYINGYFLTQSIGGVQRFARNILHELDLILDQSVVDIKLVCLVPHSVETSYKHIAIKVVKPLIDRQTYFEQITLPLHVKSEYLINLCHFAPIVKKHQLLVIHDSIYLHYPTRHSKFSLFLIRWLPRRVDNLVAVSNFIKNDLIKQYKLNKDILVVYNSADHLTPVVDNNDLYKFGLSSGCYVLMVSSQVTAIHKNFQLVKKYSEISEQCIAIVGNCEEVINNAKLLGGVYIDSDLACLYHNAFCFVFPSLQEGFGIPPLEAMTCGCPVIVSDIPVHHEVCGDAAIYFDPYDVMSLVAAIDKLKDKELRDFMIQKGYERSQKFSWAQSASKLLDYIRSSNK